MKIIGCFSDNVATHFALDTRKEKKKSGRVTTKMTTWFVFDNEEGNKVALTVKNWFNDANKKLW